MRRDEQRQGWYQVLQLRARNLRYCKDSFGLAPWKTQADVNLGTKGRRKIIQGKCCIFI